MNPSWLAESLVEIRQPVGRHASFDRLYQITWDYIMRMSDKVLTLKAASYEKTPKGWLWANTKWYHIPTPDRSLLRPVIRRWITSFAELNGKSVEDMLSMFESQ